MPISERLKRAKAIMRHLEGERRDTEDGDFKKISEYLLPHRGYWPTDGDSKSSILERGKRNVNPAATLSIERAAGGLTTGMTPEGQPWFGLRTPDMEMMDQPGVRMNLDKREKLINHVLRAGGFYQSIHVCNMELLGFGGMLMFQDKSMDTVARFEACTVGTYAIALDSEGRLDTVIRRIRWAAKDLVRKFGKENMSKRALEVYDKEPFEKIDVVHMVTPREDRDDTRIDNKNMKYKSCLFEDFSDPDERDATDVLRESGYHEMPYHYTPYSEVGSSNYGMGPGHLLVGHSRQLNETERLKVVALQKIINPPTKKPATLKGRLNVGPGQENAMSSTDLQGVGALYEIPVQGYQYTLQEIQDVMQRIAAVAKADLFFDMPAEMRPKDMTATEYMERKRERMQQVAPFVSIYEPKILDKVIERTHNMLDRMGMFPPAPQALMDAGLVEIEYISSVAKSLRQVGAESTRALMADVRDLATIQIEANQKPTVLHKIDMPQMVDEIANGVGAPASVVKDDKAYEESLAADMAREKEMQDKQMELEGADRVAKLGSVPTQGTLAGEMIKSQEAANG